MLRKTKRAPFTPDGVLLEPGYMIISMFVPPTKNREPSHWAARRAIKLQWQDDAVQLWAKAGRPRFAKLEIFPVFYHAVARQRDCDNAVGIAMKGILDGLKGRLVPDDNAELLTLHAAEFLEDHGCVRMELHILERRDGDGD